MQKLLAIGLLLFPLTACAFEGEKFGPLPSDIAPIFGGGGGSAPAAPAQVQPVQPNIPATAGVLAMQREQHGAVTPQDCQRIARRMAKRGFRLVEVRPNDLGTGGVLQYICIFESDVAQPGDGRVYGNDY